MRLWFHNSLDSDEGSYEFKKTMASFDLISKINGLTYNVRELGALIGKDMSQKLSLLDIQMMASHIGAKTKYLESDFDTIRRHRMPMLVLVNENEWIVLAKCDSDRVLIQNPGADENSEPIILPTADFNAIWKKKIILFSKKSGEQQQSNRFSFYWFFPAIKKHRTIIAEVLAISIFLQFLGLMTPLFMQLVADKVLVHRALSTLDVLLIGYLFLIIFETSLSWLRTFIFAHTTSRIDVELGVKIFHHMLNLPLSYFENRKAGDTVARVRELENLREFLTSNAITLVIDVVFSLMFILIMWSYSPTLAAMVIASLPLYFLVSLLVIPTLRRRLNCKFEKSAANQCLLIETVNGIQTVKSGSLEPHFCRRWNEQLSDYVSSAFSAQRLASSAQEAISLIGKLAGAGVIWLGAKAAINGEITLGMFIAFNMFSQRVTQPIMRIAQMWSEFQQAGISMARLSDILDKHGEFETSEQIKPAAIKGKIEFNDVSFKYSTDGANVLRNVTFSIAPGEVIGIVGRSGSGKSTVTRLIQQLYQVDKGKILIDGIDASQICVSTLRSQLGVVLQENFLFSRTIRENICISNPAADIDSIINVAKLAGAHDFIANLKRGYDTMIGEHGTGLSGGQRQRIAIARALLTNPRILIFDEATSALDYESESILQENMHAISSGRTVIIIAHRLSAVRDADRIIVMENGEVAEVGSHDDLISFKRGIYCHLWKLQSAARGDPQKMEGMQARPSSYV